MIRLFKRRSPAHRAEPRSIPAAPSVPDLLIARWHELTPEEWNDLPHLAKVDHRESYFHAWGMAS
jgi:hypothetical protein